MLRKFTAIFYFGLILALLFIAHIFLAANNLDVMFAIAAVLIAVMSLFCGPVLIFLERDESNYSFVYGIGMTLSIPLSIALGWAYNRMSTGIEMIILPILGVFLHMVIRPRFVTDTYGLK